MTQVSSTQLTLDFEPGLTDRFPTLLDCVRTGAYTNRNPLKTIAADMDMSQSELSRKLSGNPDDTRRFSLDDLDRYIAKTDDMTPIHWLVEKYLQDDADRHARASRELMRQLPEILSLIKQATK